MGRTPPSLLTDGIITLRLPCSEDIPRLVDWADSDLLEGIWIAGPPPGPDLDAWASKVISEMLAGWTVEGSVHGGGLVIDERQPFIGVIYLVPLDNNVIELTHGVAPPARGRGVATRAVRIATNWALADGKFARVELRISESHKASRRVAEKAGFRFEERFETYVEGTDETHVDVLYSRE